MDAEGMITVPNEKPGLGIEINHDRIDDLMVVDYKS